MQPPKHVVYFSDEAIHDFGIEKQGRDFALGIRKRIPFAMHPSLLRAFDSQSLAQVTAQVLDGITENTEVILIIPMQWCFVQVLKDLPGKARTEALEFAFEPFLPLPLEEVTCAFRSNASNTLAFAIPTRPMIEFLDHLAKLDVCVKSIYVDVFLAMEWENGNKPKSVMVKDSCWARGFLVDPKTCSYHPFTTSAKGVQALQSMIHAGVEADGHEGCEVYDVVGDREAAKITQDQECRQLEDLVLRSASQTPLDLRIGALSGDRKRLEISRLAQHCLALGAALALAFALVLMVQTRNTRDQQALIEAQMLKAYREVFDTLILPPGASMRLSSERVRMEGLAGKRNAASSSERKTLPPPLHVLREFVESIPSDVPILVHEARIDGQQLTLRGMTREHRDAERLVEALNRVAGVRALAPRTNRLKSGGVEFALNAGVPYAAQ